MRASHPSRFPAGVVIEPLENRRLLSADLAGVFAAAPPHAIIAGSRQHVAIRVVNHGDARASGAVTVELFAANDASPGGDILLASTTRRVDLRAGRSALVNLRFRAPQALAAGTYAFVAQVDPGSIQDANAANNRIVAPARVTVAQAFVDLRVQSVHGPDRVLFIDGQKVTHAPASVRIINKGTATASGAVSVSFYLSTDKTLDQRDVLVGALAATPVFLKPGQRQSLRARIQPPADIRGGLYFLFAVVTPVSELALPNPANGVGLAAHRVLIVRSPMSRGSHSGFTSADICYAGVPIVCAGGETFVEESSSTGPTSGDEPTPSPGDAPPDTQPTPQPIFNDPQTQPADSSPPPTDAGGSSSDFGSSDSSSSGDFSGGGDSGGGDSGGGDSGGGDF